MMDKKILAIANALAFILTVLVNYLSNIGIFNGNTVSSVSAQYRNLFTPAGYAFSIWGIIYLGLLGFIIYQAKVCFDKDLEDKRQFRAQEQTVYQIGWLFVASCLMNSLWVMVWLYDYIGISVLLMLFLLYFLFRIVLATGMELKEAGIQRIAWVWWPFSIYTGWITVALMANIAAYLTKLGWTGFTTDANWTLLLIVLAGVIGLVFTWTRNMREFAIALAWGLIAVGVANWNGLQGIVNCAFAVSLVLLCSSAIHGYRNRKNAILSYDPE